MEQDETFKLIEQLPFFADFTPKERLFLSKLETHIYRYFASEYLIREGETDYSFFILLKGIVSVTKSNHIDVTIAKLKSGAVFGEIAYLAKRKRITSIIAEGDIIALKIDTKSIKQLKPEIIIKLKDKLIEVLVNRLETMNEQVTRNL